MSEEFADLPPTSNHYIDERHVLEELENICTNYPLWPGSTINHATANECGRRGWSWRGGPGKHEGCWYPTEEGVRVWMEARSND